MVYEMTQPNDPGEMKKAAQESWICNMFQKAKLKPDEKKEILKSLVKDIRQKREDDRLAMKEESERLATQRRRVRYK